MQRCLGREMRQQFAAMLWKRNEAKFAAMLWERNEAKYASDALEEK